MVVPRMSRTGIFERLGDFGEAVGGAVAIYVAFAGVALMGAMVLALDVGRLTVVRTQMQNAADAACLSAVIQLDGRADAIDRAKAVAREAALPTSNFAVVSGTTAITIAPDPNGLVFFTNATKTTATVDDATAYVLQVTLDTRSVSLLLQPAFAVWASVTKQSFSNVGATASCTNEPIICNPPSFMTCNVTNISPYDVDLTAVSSAGIQIQLHQPKNNTDPVTPGNFSLVCPGSKCGASEVKKSLAAIDTGSCQGGFITTSPGVAQGPVNSGINTRFDLGAGKKNPAEDISYYLRDDDFINEYIGNGDWDPAGYWLEAHGDGYSFDGTPEEFDHNTDDGHNDDVHSGNPPAVPADPNYINFTRYQMYLYELGESFARNTSPGACDGVGTSDCRTIYPIPAGGLDADDLAAGFTPITLPPAEISANNTTTPNPSPADPRRRVFKVAVVKNCSTASTTGGAVKGKTDIPFENFDIVDMFITEPAGDPSEFYVFLEVMEYVGTMDSPDLIANARLLIE